MLSKSSSKDLSNPTKYSYGGAGGNRTRVLNTLKLIRITAILSQFIKILYAKTQFASNSKIYLEPQYNLVSVSAKPFPISTAQLTSLGTPPCTIRAEIVALVLDIL